MAEHWAVDVIRQMEDRKWYGELTLRFRNGICELLEEKRTIKPPQPSERIAGAVK